MLVFVVGVYKSGTSMITSMIEQMGIPTVVENFRKTTSVVGTKQIYNILESYEVNILNNDIIKSTNQNEMYLDINRMPNDISIDLKERIDNFYKKINYNGVIKDPRFICTLQYWLKKIPNNIKYKIIWVKRNNIEDIIASFKSDRWFIDKIDNKNYKFTIEKLYNNYTIQFNNINNGIELEYNFILKYKNESYMLIFNYINSSNYNSIKKIYFSEYYLPPDKLKELFSRQVPSSIPVWENIVAVDSQDEADFIIIQDKTKDIIKEKNKIIFFGREPKHVPGGYREWNDLCFKKLHHENNNFWLPQTWWLDINYDELCNIDPIKTKNISVIDSGKINTEFHSFRINIINELIKNYKNDIDVYGGINNNILPFRDKKNGLLDYKYYLSIENGKTNNYFSEKICDAILCLCMPIYWGCNKLEEFLPEGSFIRIDDTRTIPEMAKQIIDISKSDIRNNNIDKIKQARDLILNKYNIWPTIKYVIEN